MSQKVESRDNSEILDGRAPTTRLSDTMGATQPAPQIPVGVMHGATLWSSSANVSSGSMEEESRLAKQAAASSPVGPRVKATTPQVVSGTWHAVAVGGTTFYQSGETLLTGPISLTGRGTLFVDGGATASGVISQDSANTVIINDGGVLTNSIIENGWVSVNTGGISQRNDLNSDWVYIESGATSTDDTFYNSGHAGCTVWTSSGGGVVNPVINNGATIVVSGGTVSGGAVGSGGSILVNSDGTANGVDVAPGGKGDFNGTTSGGAIVPDMPGPPGDEMPVLTGTWYARNVNGITVYQSGDVTIDGPVNFQGSNLYIENGAVVSGLINETSYANFYIESGGTFMNSRVTNGWVYVSGGGTSMYNYVNSDPFRIYSGGVSINDTFYKDMELSDPVYVSSGGTVIDPIVHSGGVISVYDGGTIVDPTVTPGGSIYVNGGGMDACFLMGTKIKTPQGEVAVENLRVGDVVVTYGPEKIERTIKWIGRQMVSVPPSPEMRKENSPNYPIRVLKNALDCNCPAEDLLVTEEHCIAVDGRFHPIRMLVNNKTIFYDTNIASYTYFHIETDVHCVLCANGAPFESYLNTSDYHGFDVAGSMKSDGMTMPKTWSKDAALPLSVDRQTVEALHQRLEARANAEGFLSKVEQQQLIQEHGLHLLLPTGERVGPHRVSEGTFYFSFAPEHKVVYLASRASRASDVIGPFVDDRRNLGVLIDRITIIDGEGGKNIRSFLEHEDLPGWHGLEGNVHRWTNGCAKLPLINDSEGESEILLAVHVVHGGPYLGTPHEEPTCA